MEFVNALEIENWGEVDPRDLLAFVEAVSKLEGQHVLILRHYTEKDVCPSNIRVTIECQIKETAHTYSRYIFKNYRAKDFSRQTITMDKRVFKRKTDC